MTTDSPLQYMNGFANEFSTEALPGALPDRGNSPQKAPYGLYAEQINGTPFTIARAANRRSWLYRIRPGAAHDAFAPGNAGAHWLSSFNQAPTPPNRMRWDPIAMPAAGTKVDFVDSMMTIGGNAGCGIHVYTATRSMEKRYFYDSDGELLIVPQQGRLTLATELGNLEVEPQEIAVIPRGIRFQVRLRDGAARGFVCENFGAPLQLPTLGVIGSNGLAHPRDFLTPVAAWEDVEGDFEILTKFDGQFWTARINHSPLDVVAWHGTHAPYKYDLRKFNVAGFISYDHPDPCMNLVLHAPSAAPGVDTLDFIAFAPRVLAMLDTFRPPWFHRNVAGEFMGNVHGHYDAKAGGFEPGSMSIHNTMTAHGPDTETFEKASAADTSKPDYIKDTMAIMFETPVIIHATQQALESPHRQREYVRVWEGLKKHFNPKQR
ncbi:MAG: Homogentisate 1,2-dioxygenase [Burkholderiaceae bacterium]|nr:MAG: Homogentisate 1,2-dioxygenase [Burkholderiaceae bacterium]